MSDITDISSRLRRTDENRGVAICSEAADTIDRLRAERDETRRELCRIESSASGDPTYTRRAAALDRGWDCFKEDGK